MPILSIHNASGEVVGQRDMAPAVFGVAPAPGLLHDVVVMQDANRRRGTASTKTRAEVRGGGRKPWRQKGTGRARHGSIRSPLWRKGGVAFGPRPRDYGYTMPVKARRLALRAALSAKVQAGEIILVDDLGLREGKTRELAAVLERLGAPRALIVTEAADPMVLRASRNLAGSRSLPAAVVSVRDLLAHPRVIMTVGAAARIEEALGQ